MTTSLFEQCVDRLESIPSCEWSGRVTAVRGATVESRGPRAAVGEACRIVRGDGRVSDGEIIGFRGDSVLSMSLDDATGIRFGDSLSTRHAFPFTVVGDDLIGRVIDATGNPLDGGSAITGSRASIRTQAPQAMARIPIDKPLSCGIRAIDGFLTCGQGQRVGIFGGSGVGKSTLIGMMVKNTAADVIVLALVGERGREVREFLDHSLGAEGVRRSVVVVSTSDQSPLLRIRAALSATAIAENFRERGKNVLLIMDSITRLAMAQREIGLAAGEPPTAKGYTPSVFTQLAQLVERAGRTEKGSLTAFYTVLMEGDDQMDPIVDSVRSLLDGHIMLDRRLAAENHYPAINILDSVSRLMPSICSREHLTKAAMLRKTLAVFARSEDLIKIGAYQKGSSPELDSAIEVVPAVQAFLQQSSRDPSSFDDTMQHLLSIGKK